MDENKPHLECGFGKIVYHSCTRLQRQLTTDNSCDGSIKKQRLNRHSESDLPSITTCQPHAFPLSSPAKITAEGHHPKIAPVERSGVERLDLSAWVKTAKKCKKKSSYQSPPEDILKLLSRLCRQNKVKACRWSHSPEDTRTIIVCGDGTSKIEDKFKSAYTVGLDDFKFKFVDSKLINHPLSGKIHAHNSGIPVDSTCELLVYPDDQRPSSAPHSVFATTTAHSLMTRNEKATLDTGQIQQSDHIQMLEQVCGRFDGGILEGIHRRNSTLSVEIEGQPLVAYRPQSHASRGLPHMIDLALFKIDPQAVGRFSHCLELTDMCRFSGLSSSVQGEDLIDQLISAKGRIARIVPPSQSLVPGFELGNHIAFTIEEGEEFQEGDSGSILYIETQSRGGNTNRYAVSMLSGVRPGTYYMAKRVYQAIFLLDALEEIRSDCLQGNTRFEVFLTRPQQRGPRPPVQ